MRRGFSLHELLISLTMMSVVLGIATHFAMRHLRVFRSVAATSAQRSQLEQVTEILRNVLANVSPVTGELLVAQDTAVEIRATTGTSFVCSGAPGTVVVPAPDASIGRMPPFVRPPAPGDRLSALFSDSLGATWLHLQVASAPMTQGPCSFNPELTTTWSITTVEPMSLPPGTALRLTRPLRLSLYRSSDRRWYLGAKDWNGELQRFNTIQPVAGPLLSYGDKSGPGLHFVYRDAAGQELAPPIDGTRVTSIVVAARVTTDSMVAVVRLANGR